MSLRIAIGGFQHETNTFAPSRATFADFERADGWPGLARGAALEPAVAGINLPVAGFIERARARGDRLLPLLWCSASPSGFTTDEAYERIAGLLLGDLAAALPVDAVYLDLHGAMVTQSLEDGEGELLRRVRALVGPAVPVVASLDLHANISAAMVEHATALVAYRTYPHVDMAETGARAADILARIAAAAKPAKAFRQGVFLIPLPAQCTLVDPARALYAAMAELSAGPVWSMSLAPGFAAADIADSGPSILAYGDDPGAVTAAADNLAGRLAALEPAFRLDLMSPDAAVASAIELAARGERPVVLADTQDNPGGGAAGDGVAILESLVRHDAQGAVLGLLCDARAASAAHAAGVGATLDIGLGAGSRYGGASPLTGSFVVERLGDGRFTGTGPFYGGNRMQLGPMALLRIGGVRVAVSSAKQQAADQAMFRHLGVEPAEAPILALKSSVHFRADFGPLAAAILLVEAPGANAADPATQPFRRLRDGMRLRPGGPVFRRPTPR